MGISAKKSYLLDFTTIEKGNEENSLHLKAYRDKKALHKVIMPYQPDWENRRVRITYTNESNTSELIVIYKIFSKEEVLQCLIEGKQVNLDYCYIDEGYLTLLSYVRNNLYKIWYGLSAKYSFWNGGAYFNEVCFKNNAITFDYAIFNNNFDFKETVLM